MGIRGGAELRSLGGRLSLRLSLWYVHTLSLGFASITDIELASNTSILSIL